MSIRPGAWEVGAKTERPPVGHRLRKHIFRVCYNALESTSATGILTVAGLVLEVYNNAPVITSVCLKD